MSPTMPRRDVILSRPSRRLRLQKTPVAFLYPDFQIVHAMRKGIRKNAGKLTIPTMAQRRPSHREQAKGAPHPCR